MNANIQKTDLLIVGGGMVGLSMALKAAKQLPQAKIVLLEAFDVPSVSEGSLSFRPSFDARSTALSESTRQFFQQIDLWSKLSSHITAIDNIHVSDRGHIGATVLNAQEEQLPALGYVIENAWLGQVLMAEVTRHPNIQIISPVKPAKITPQKDAVLVSLSNEEVWQAKLLVVADGAASQTRAMLGIGHERQDYGQQGIIANVSFTKAHQGRAFERFTDQGPIALLPLQEFENQPRSALIWTLPPETCQQLMELDDESFLAQLQQRFGQRLGTFTSVGQRHSYPIQLVTAKELCRRNVVVIGNAASSLHPVAGQGFNLALRGVSQLVECLQKAHSDNISLGDLAVLQSFSERHQQDRTRTIMMSDLLPKVFGNSGKALAAGRNASLLAMDAIPALRTAFSRMGTGLKLDKGLV